MARVISTAAGTAALVGLLALGATGQLPLGTFNALTAGGSRADSIDGGVRIVPPSATSLSPGDTPAEEGDGMSKTDFEGDEVSPALATYGIDREGNLFEVHSPHTEVPRLAGPTT
jgi:hypothetical protein